MRRLLRSLVEEGQTLSREEARTLLAGILGGSEASPCTDAELAALLTAMAVRGETAAELTGFAEAMRAAATPLPFRPEERAQLVDTCGTGGDGHGTFNISTGAALVAAAAGARVAKHGNRAVTSLCGSADVLQALGIAIDLDPARAVECLRATGFMFLLATALHPAMRRVAPVRQALGFRTIFNLAGPLTNPAGAEAQVMGVYAEVKIGVVAEAMTLLGVRHAFVVHGDAGQPGAGLDELTVTGPSQIAEVRRADASHAAPPAAAPPAPHVVRRFTIEPEQFGLARAPLSALGGGNSAEESAAVLLAVFRGEEIGPPRDVIVLNAAAALVVGSVAADFAEGLARASEAINAGKVERLLTSLRAFSRPARQ